MSIQNDLSKYTDSELYAELTRRAREHKLTAIEYFVAYWNSGDAPDGFIKGRYGKEALDTAIEYCANRIAIHYAIPVNEVRVQNYGTAVALFIDSNQSAIIMIDGMTVNHKPVSRLD